MNKCRVYGMRQHKMYTDKVHAGKLQMESIHMQSTCGWSHKLLIFSYALTVWRTILYTRISCVNEKYGNMHVVRVLLVLFCRRPNTQKNGAAVSIRSH